MSFAPNHECTFPLKIENEQVLQAQVKLINQNKSSWSWYGYGVSSFIATSRIHTDYIHQELHADLCTPQQEWELVSR